jgi:hypothetical protein
MERRPRDRRHPEDVIDRHIFILVRGLAHLESGIVGIHRSPLSHRSPYSLVGDACLSSFLKQTPLETAKGEKILSSN